MEEQIVKMLLSNYIGGWNLRVMMFGWIKMIFLLGLIFPKKSNRELLNLKIFFSLSLPMLSTLPIVKKKLMMLFNITNVFYLYCT